MNKIGLIISREYLTRVRNKTFLLSTFLLPVIFLLFIVGSAFFASSSKKEFKKIAVINDPGIFKNNLKSDSGYLSFYFPSNIDTSNFDENGYAALLDLNNDSLTKNFTIHSKKQLDIDSKEMIETLLDKAFENSQLQKKGIQKSILDSINKLSSGTYHIANDVTEEQGKSQEVNAALNYGIGFGCGFLIYITTLLFGAMVMRGVMEEKTNRIAEIIISSVKPFELMMGKILGIAAVGLTQLFLWIILITFLSTASTAFLPHDILQQASHANQSYGGGGSNAMLLKALEVKQTISSINWFEIISFFLFYFLGGFLFYAALFASVGSAVNEDAQEAQSLMLPITMPLIFSFIILSSNLTTPDNTVMVWASIIPFTSPVVMMGRIPSGGVPFWQIGVSIFFLVGGFVFTTWLAAKIYRTGILMYGKKPSWKEMLKWAFRKS
ncbi:MAG: ABC transporter permease [Ferruginibacter sp.]